MKIFKKVPQYILIFLLGGVVGLFLALSGVTYFLTSAILDSRDPQSELHSNANLQAVFSIGVQYAQELNKVRMIQDRLTTSSSNAICSQLCATTHIQEEKLQNEGSDYLLKFLNQSEAVAQKDPIFQIRVLELTLLEKIFPQSTRKVLLEMQDAIKSQPSTFSKLILSFKLQFSLISSGFQVLFLKNDLKNEIKRLQLLRKLRKECQKGVSPRKIRQECENFAAH